MTNTKKKILLIDDDPSVSAALSMLLKDDYEPYAAETVREGIRLFDSLQPSVVILDLHLPDQHGLEALRSIRSVDRSARVIILTGYATLDVVEESMRLGASDCLHKPFNAAVLRSRLKELIEEEEVEEAELSVAEAQTSYPQEDERLVSSAFLHDVSNPLTSLQALTLLLKEGSDDEETRRKLTRMIEQNVSYLSSLIDQWRAFSEPHALAKEYASLSEIAHDAASFVSLRAEAKGIALVVDAEPSDLAPQLNRHATARILVNLLQNAIEASPRSLGKVTIRAYPKNGSVEFTIRDNGDGIPPSETQRVFEPRYTTKKKGTGLGLFIARHIVERAKGSITICSRPGRGTTFTVQLPAC
ncbi:hybrid sensor histidine kinase/response regulator [Pelagicoccus sp. NFK12]|uniref:histidine kinase n=1 Tax=Pelagicoccus enzymogenes TaxID=2773457 RepID=A0A927FAE9_9BACT|nr:hybrid sensor histidine kinase/response regulator [Pelagicoccus enzymogenes]MBD5781342.1 hybrid sensor histidine kinase/response regulator [Pelagicoccus enzymogenes]MDQ8199602.1 hybrid sensor histidine kinase/response regulator [Pelagicoccus enzymogenes]